MFALDAGVEDRLAKLMNKNKAEKWFKFCILHQK